MSKEKVDPDFTEESKALGYYPFIRFSPLEWLTLKELYGDWAFQLFSRLKDPARLHPDWAVSFAGAAASLPSEEVLEAESIHVLVTGAKVYRYRKDHINRFNRCFFDVVWQRMKEGALDIDEPHRSLYLADFERWRVHLKACSEAQRVAAEKAAEALKLKAQRRAEHLAVEAVARERKASTAQEKPPEKPRKDPADVEKKTAEDKAAAEAKAAEEKNASDMATERQKSQTLPGGAAPQRKGAVIERKSSGSPVKPPSGGAWRNPNPRQPLIVRKKIME
ncbi:MAG TPA: hypothetical protein VE954_41730 [Oligoflexus sp.]|uniref:hypothetical protein n=1 Tax=Oligoflexus sp. TaxID=1971216 RepID=UPI002D240C8D|nr:hypothetical protein [Oligoflexus sp.]HYX39663.1 hypothetical protein [Oligoflexus sp.]